LLALPLDHRAAIVALCDDAVGMVRPIRGEPMPQWGIFEYTRRCAEALGCVEWYRQQEQARGDRWSHVVSGPVQNFGAVMQQQLR
jgi:hypothetical protein